MPSQISKILIDDKYIALNQTLLLTCGNIRAFSKLNDQGNSLKWELGNYLSKTTYSLPGF